MDTAQPRHLHIVSHKKVVLAFILAAFFIIAVGALWLMRNSPLFPAASTTNQVDLLSSGWDHVPGVTPASDGLHVTYLGRAIVQQDGSPGLDNPSINLYGTHLHTTKDFTLSAALKDVNGGASLRLYAEAPIVQDEFRVEPKGLDITIENSVVTVARWDGYKNQKLLQQKPTNTTSYPIGSQKNLTLTFEHTGNQLAILSDDKELTTLPYSNYFNQEMWFGVSALDPGDTWTLASLSASSNAGGVSTINTQQTTKVKQTNPDSFQTLAKKKRSDFLIGAAVALTPSVADEKYRDLVYGGNFGMITTENVLKWQFVHPQPQVYDFKEADALVDIARKNGLHVQGHTLVFGEANPKWVQELPTTSQADKDAVKQVMIDHITKTVTHFGDRIMAWDVVNEPLAEDVSDSNILRNHKWHTAMGESYIATALSAAHTANPKAKLYINDFGLEADGERWDAMLALVKKLKAQNVPLDGIGFESHVYEAGDEIDPTVLRQHIQALSKLGVSSHVSEMDVHSDDGSATQAKQYADVLSACINEPSCTSWATWGVTDRYDIFEADSGKLKYGQDFLWDARSNPTPAVAEIQKTLKE